VPLLARCLVPDLSFTAAVATLLCVFAGSAGPSGLLRDSDTGWHVRNGERILSDKTLPQQDPFTFSKPHARWIAWEWGTDVLDAVVHRAAGLGGIAALYGIAIAAAVWMWFRLTWAVEGSFVLAPFLAAPAIAATSLHWLARPHAFGWLFLLAAVWWCERARNPAPVHLAAIAICSALWANMHGSFILGPLVAFVYAAGAFLRALIWGGELTATRHLLAAAAACAGTLANPYGVRLHEHVFRYLTDSALLDRIGEFQSFNFHNQGSLSVMVALIASMGGGFAALAIRRPERFFLSVLFVSAALYSARAIPLTALALLPLANGTFTELIGMAGGLRLPLRKNLDQALRYGEALRRFDKRFGGWALMPVTAALVLFAVNGRAAFPADQFPVAAATSIAGLSSDARLFSSDKFGGYVIYRFAGQRPVFFDGRSDFYGTDFITRYATMIDAQPGWREEFGRWRFTHALLPPNAPLLSALESAGWQELHRDRTSVLLGDR